MGRYPQRKIGGRTYQIHRLVMEDHLGFPIPEGFIVHHRNGDPTDFRIENLELMTCQEHAVHHNQKHPVTKVCIVCASVFEPHPTKRVRAKTCSRICFGTLMSKQARERASDPAHRVKMSEAAHRNGSAERAKTLVKTTRWKDHVPTVLRAVCACGCGEAFEPCRKNAAGVYFRRGHHKRLR